MPKARLLAFEVNPRFCKSCEICVALCPLKLLRMEGKHPACSDVERCTVCRMCELHCPDLAIALGASEDE